MALLIWKEKSQNTEQSSFEHNYVSWDIIKNLQMGAGNIGILRTHLVVWQA
jgi:hypothetical protein